MKDFIKEIDKLLEDYEMTDIKDYVYNNIKNSIYLSLTANDDYTVQGVSRVGGYPDVPPNFDWPSTTGGEPMTFIAQVTYSHHLRGGGFLGTTN